MTRYINQMYRTMTIFMSAMGVGERGTDDFGDVSFDDTLEPVIQRRDKETREHAGIPDM